MMAKFCISCGSELPEGAVACPNCGATQNVTPQVQPQVVVNNVQPQVKTNGIGLAGFIVSLVSLLMCCGGLSVVSLVLSIVGLIKSKDYNGNGKGFSIAGIIISVVGIITFITLFFIYVLAYIDGSTSVRY